MHVTKINRSRCSIARKQLDAQTDSAESLLEDLEHYSSTLYNNTRNDRRYAQNESATYLAGKIVSKIHTGMIRYVYY